MFAALFKPTLHPIPSVSVIPAERTPISKALQSIAHGFMQIFKANPYHDAGGRFARADAPATHHFVSVGGKFSRSNTRDRKAFGTEQTALGNKLKPLFNEHKEQRLSRIQGVVDQKFNDAIPAPAAPARRTRSTTPRAPSAAQTARAAALAQREAVAARRAELITQRQDVVRNNANFRASQTTPLRPGERERLQATIDNPHTSEYSRNNARARIAGAAHGDLLRQHELTLNSTLATAGRVPAHHLRPDTMGQSLHDLNTANATARAEVAHARHVALGATMYGMGTEERRQHLRGLSTQAQRAANRALTDHVSQEAARLDGLSHPERQAQLDAMSEGQRNAIHQNQSWYQRQNWQRQATHHNESVAESERLKREGPNTGERLHNMSADDHAKAMAGLTESQRANAHASEVAHANARAAALTSLRHASRERELAGMSDRQRETVTGKFTQEQQDSHGRQRVEHHQREAERAVAEAAAHAAREQRERTRIAIENATIDNLPEHAKAVHKELKELSARGMNANASDERQAHKVATALSQHYPHVTPHEIVDALMGKNAKISNGSMSIDHRGNIVITALHGSTVHGARVQRKIQRTFNKETGVVDHDWLDIERPDRGMGAVKKNFANAVPIYHKMGMKKIDVHGALEGGFHTWARYGFNDDRPPAWHDQAKGMANRALSQIPDTLKTPEVHREIAQLEELSAKYGHTKEFPRLYTAAQTPHLDKAWAATGRGSSGDKSKFKFDALANGNWYGNIKLSDREQMKHLADYVGKSMPHHKPNGEVEWIDPTPGSGNP